MIGMKINSKLNDMKPNFFLLFFVATLINFNLSAQRKVKPDMVLLDNVTVDRVDKNIELTKLTNKAWLIQSSYACDGILDCNHLLIIDRNDIVLVNTPASDSLTAVLLNCIEKKFKRKVTKLIVSHFHDDSSGGLAETGKRGIKSYALDKTRDLLKKENKKTDIVFTDSLNIPLQSLNLKLVYFGAGHSVDNIVIWVPDGKILFGGCLLKSLTSSDKGNIKDADLQAWSQTIQKVKDRFGSAKIVIPGHGAIGDCTIFDHTMGIVTN